VLAALKAMGMKLAIDDFGTGYSSLSYLKRFPIDTLKIDQSFVRDVATDGDDATIVGAVIEMGRNLKQRVIAEGIETPAQLDFLRAQHCDEGQGFHFSHPLSAEAFGHLLPRASPV
jgi:EAL domain-containing protein (putative c-di-GMP-specific phosphodiesterase class I)